jgi:hypothetical protein
MSGLAARRCILGILHFDVDAGTGARSGPDNLNWRLSKPTYAYTMDSSYQTMNFQNTHFMVYF